MAIVQVGPLHDEWTQCATLNTPVAHMNWSAVCFTCCVSPYVYVSLCRVYLKASCPIHQDGGRMFIICLFSYLVLTSNELAFEMRIER